MPNQEWDLVQSKAPDEPIIEALRLVAYQVSTNADSNSLLLEEIIQRLDRLEDRLQGD